jgi:sugar O-acyltransferase (sialic acid O-acetyltransferase NeuD family)
VLIDCLQRQGIAIAGCLDADPILHDKLIGGVKVLGDDAVLSSYSPQDVLLVNGIGSTRSMDVRRAIFQKLSARNYSFAKVVHDSAIIGDSTVLGEGVQVMAGAIVQTACKIGANAIINSGVIVDHDCVIGDHVHLAPGTVLSGAVQVGSGTHIGTGAVIVQGIKIGTGCLIAAGAVVIQNVPDDSTAFGVPASLRRP